ncbi:MAG: flagellar brake protein, partial [bacterium]
MLKLWERVTVKVPVGEFDANYVTRVQNIDEEGLHLDRPGIEGRLFPLRVGGGLVVEFTREDAIYRFRSQVVRFYQEANLPFMVISHPQEIERAQRRQFFRLELEIPIRYYIPIDLDRLVFHPAQKGRVKDI